MSLSVMSKPDGTFATLKRLGLTSEQTREVYSSRTRDSAGLTVYRDTVTGIVYIDDFYVGDQTYEAAEHRRDNFYKKIDWDYEYQQDQLRRVENYAQFYAGKTITEFGCWQGAFLKIAAARGAKVSGIELHKGCVDALNAEGYRCVTSAAELEPGTQDTVFAFHVLEHLHDPLAVLDDLAALLKPGGTLVVEVPHACDFLLSGLDCESFKKFTLWSQHLVLHTRESLRRLMNAAGFKDLYIEGVQRYPLSNHLQWLTRGRPGGHKGLTSALETPELRAAYEAALRKIDATDTLVAIARKD